MDKEELKVYLKDLKNKLEELKLQSPSSIESFHVGIVTMIDLVLKKISQ